MKDSQSPGDSIENEDYQFFTIFSELMRKKDIGVRIVSLGIFKPLTYSTAILYFISLFIIIIIIKCLCHPSSLQDDSG